MYKSGFVSIIGRPNVGKSTLMNTLLGEKLSIVSPRPQTTRNNIQTILTGEDYQIVFVDTPGIHKPKHKLGEYMVNVAENSINEVDLILYIVTPSEEINKGDLHILEQLKKSRVPVILLINKVDEWDKQIVAKTLELFSKEFPFKEYLPISALKNKNLDQLLSLMKDNLSEGPQFYPEDMITDQQERFIVSEIIREKILRLMREEVPHGTAVEILEMKQLKNGWNIEATIYCEKDSHKGILIGKNGTMLKKIREYSEEDIKKFLQQNITLNLWVKVKKDWRDNNYVLKDLGYK
ncbi:MAG: GTPase Era [Bacillota bacterium]|nr:GTPase Era [Bacillota bacterium]